MVGPLDVLQDVVDRFEKASVEYFLVGSLADLIHQASGIKIDIMLRKNTEFSLSEFGRRTKVSLAPNFEAYIASPEDVIIKKLDFHREGGSEEHLVDVREILAGTEVDKDYLEKWVDSLGLRREWEKI